MLGPDGVLAHCRSGQVVVDLSTASPESSVRIHDRLASSGVAFLDAGISGGARGAEAGTLTVMVGGNAAASGRQCAGHARGLQHTFHRHREIEVTQLEVVVAVGEIGALCIRVDGDRALDLAAQQWPRVDVPGERTPRSAGHEQQLTRAVPEGAFRVGDPQVTVRHRGHAAVEQARRRTDRQSDRQQHGADEDGDRDPHQVP